MLPFSSRSRKLLGWLSVVLAGLALAFVSHWLKWRDSTTLFAGALSVAVLVPLVLPFMLGPFERLTEGQLDLQARPSLFRLAFFLPAPAIGYLGYLIARPQTAHWGTAGVVGVYAAVTWLALATPLLGNKKRRGAVGQ